MGDTVTDHVAASRFELAFGDAVAFVSYRRTGRVLALTHAEVPPRLGGRGVGSALVRAVLELVRARGERVVPRCPFVAAFIDKHPEYRDLVVDGR
jgi:predicted GNAT family acetyltransferase